MLISLLNVLSLNFFTSEITKSPDLDWQFYFETKSRINEVKMFNLNGSYKFYSRYTFKFSAILEQNFFKPLHNIGPRILCLEVAKIP